MVSDAKTENFSKGKYTYVGLDIDTTGRRLIDEVSLNRWRLSSSKGFQLITFFPDCEHRRIR